MRFGLTNNKRYPSPRIVDSIPARKEGICIAFIFGPAGKIIKCRLPPTVFTERKAMSDFPAHSFNCPWCQVHGILIEWFPRL